MKLLLMLAALLPRMIVSQSTAENEKYKMIMTPSQGLYCSDFNPLSHLDLHMIMGQWNGVEIITHYETEAEKTVPDSCVVVDLAEMNDSEDDSDYTNYGEKNADSKNRRLRLSWDEGGKIIEYTLRVDGSRQGFWNLVGVQKGTILDLPYNQFTGTVQVMKAAGVILVLTFCEALPKSQIFTIILIRKTHHMSSEEVESIRNILKRRGLSFQSVREVCSSSSSATAATFVSIFSLVIASILSQNFQAFL